MTSTPKIKVGQIWRKVDPYGERLVEVVEYHNSGLPRNVKIKALDTQRHAWASESRFNGNPRGYALVKEAKTTQELNDDSNNNGFNV